MDAYSILLVIVAGGFVLLTIVMLYFILAKGANAHNEKKAHEQAQLDRKHGKVPPAHEATPLPGKTAGKGEEPGWFKKNWPSLLLVVVGAGLVIWGFNTPVQPADVGSLSRKYWLPLLVIWGVGAALIALNPETVKKAAGVLQLVLFGAMFMLFIGFSVIGWFGGSSSPRMDVNKQSEKVLTLSMPANGDSPRLRGDAGQKISFTGTGFTTHCVYADESEGVVGDPVRPCKDGQLYVFVRDTSGKPNMVSYEFR